MVPGQRRYPEACLSLDRLRYNWGWQTANNIWGAS